VVTMKTDAVSRAVVDPDILANLGSQQTHLEVQRVRVFIRAVTHHVRHPVIGTIVYSGSDRPVIDYPVVVVIGVHDPSQRQLLRIVQAIDAFRLLLSLRQGRQ